MLSCMITVISAYGSYYTSETLMGASGLLAVVCNGFTMSWVGEWKGVGRGGSRWEGGGAWRGSLVVVVVMVMVMAVVCFTMSWVSEWGRREEESGKGETCLRTGK